MANLDERVGHLEGRMLEQSQGIADIRDGVARLDTKSGSSTRWSIRSDPWRNACRCWSGASRPGRGDPYPFGRSLRGVIR
jgi:hypothetical protein